MRLLKLMTLVAMISTICTVTAQNPKRANIWYFGMNAGLDFTNGNPVALTNGVMQASEGAAVACDDNGNLQFYTNGGDLPYTGAVWNKNHQAMPNGFLGHTGCASSIQSSLPVNLPGSRSIYYLFTTDCYENGFENGLNYSIIDMTLDGGLGDVVEKGNLLTRNTTESLCAALHANGKEYWIITHKVDTDSFYVFRLTSNGITGVVKSRVGFVADESAGEIKVSNNGQRLVFAGNYTSTGLFDFDAATGVVSNYRNLGVVNGFTACFSPNCELLYVSNFIGQKIYQFDMLAHDVSASKTLIATPYNYVGSLQLGPDDKIYGAVRNSQYLAVISRPNIRGVDCGYNENGVHLGGKLSKYGLPNYANNVLGECLAYPVENVSKYDFFLLEKYIGQNNATVYWNDVPGATEYRIDYRKDGNSEWQTLNTSSNVYAFTNLDENSAYEFRMKSIQYANGEYEFIYNHPYAAGSIQNTEVGSSLKLKTGESLSFNLYPIPATDVVNVELNANEAQPVEVFITDVAGKTIYNQKFDMEERQRLEIATAEFPNGSYQLTVRCNGQIENKKLIVMN